MTTATHPHDERQRVAAVERKRGRSGRDNPEVGRPRHSNTGKSARPTSKTQFSVYSGTDRLGSFRIDGDAFEAFDRLGRSLGQFPTEREAIAAIDPSEAP
jgi:hypothetical protein